MEYLKHGVTELSDWTCYCEQDEKNQLLEQNASLKGTISALETQLQASKLAAGGFELHCT